MQTELETVILLDGLTFPEAPRWYDGRLWLSDFYSHRVLAMAMDGRYEVIATVPGRPSGLGWRDGKLVIVSMLDRQVLQLTSGGLELVADLIEIATGPCNDLIVDAGGRIFVGNFGFDRHASEPMKAACLARIDTDGSVTRVAEEMRFPNGMVISPDGKSFIVAESLGGCLTRFDLGSDGTLSNRRSFAELPGSFPDGICLDTENAVWIADPFGSRVVRVTEDGQINRVVTLRDRAVYACMLGGDDRRSLFLCTSTTVGPQAALERGGRIEMIRVDVAGAGLP